MDVADLGGLSDEITIECWVYGDPEQPQNGTLFEGLNANNQRVVNVHLPWGNGRDLLGLRMGRRLRPHRCPGGNGRL